MKKIFRFSILFALAISLPSATEVPAPYILILGTAQDGGYPQAGCKKDCCVKAWRDVSKRRMVSCIALVDPATSTRLVFDCTPDFPAQLRLLDSLAPLKNDPLPQLFLTHAHMGHYAGLMHLGREVMATKDVKVWAMPKMKTYLETNGPWSQLVKLNNIILQPLRNDSAVSFKGGISVIPFLVPHRDEYSETVGYRILTASKSIIFIPDIDKWSKWGTDIREVVKKNDVVLIDGTFFKAGEISRNMAEVPHPFITESMELFKALSAADKAKIYFIHLNHTNPALQEGGKVEEQIKKAGFNLAVQGQKMVLSSGY